MYAYTLVIPSNFDSNNPSPIINDCVYSTQEDFTSDAISPDRNLTIIHFNIRSLSKNFDNLRDTIQSLPEFSVIALSETWLKSSSPDVFQLPGYQLITRNRLHRVGGGVALYIHSSIHFIIRDDLSTTSSLRWKLLQEMLLLVSQASSSTTQWFHVYLPECNCSASQGKH